MITNPYCRLQICYRWMDVKVYVYFRTKKKTTCNQQAATSGSKPHYHNIHVGDHQWLIQEY